MEEDTIPISNILDFCWRHAQAGLRHVSLSGGEPTLHPDIVELVSELLSLYLAVTLTTNAVVAPSLITLLKKGHVQPTPSLRIRVSIDGSKKIHDYNRGRGTYRIATEEIHRIKDWADWVGVNTVIDRIYDSLGPLCQELAELNVDEWALMTPVYRGRYTSRNINKNKALQALQSCAQYIKSSSFTGHVTQWDYLSHPNGGLLVDADGTVMLPGITPIEDIIVGNIQEVTPELLNHITQERLHKDPIAFFCWEED